jgi:hypothetical protein
MPEHYYEQGVYGVFPVDFVALEPLHIPEGAVNAVSNLLEFN